MSCCGRLMSLTWDMYECEYKIPWLRILKPLILVCMNGMRPLIMLRGSFMWNLEPCGKVMNFEVESRNGIHHAMNDGLKVGCLEWRHINPSESHYELLVAVVSKP